VSSRITRTLTAALSLAVVGSAVAVGVPQVAQGAQAQPAPRPIVTGWMPYWMPGTATSSVTTHADLFSEASPFLLQTTSTTGITFQASAATLQSMVTSLHASGVKVIPTLTTSMDADKFAALLSDRSRRAAHARAIVAMATKFGVDGVDLDYESINFGSNAAKDVVRAKYPLLLAKLDAGLAANGMITSVTVPPRRSDSDANWWVFDYPALGAVVDRFRIMTYDYSWSGGTPGPMAPKAWVDQVIGYAATRVTPSKISIGMPAYGRDWFVREVSGRCPAAARASLSRTTQGMQDFAASRGIDPTWSAAQSSRTFTYTQRYDVGGKTCKAKRVVWYDDARSVAAKLPLVDKHGVRGIAIWALGNETAGMWDRLAAYATVDPLPAARVTVSAPSRITFGKTGSVSGVVRVSGSTTSGATVTLWRRPMSGSWTTVGSSVSTGSGSVSFAVSPRRHTQYRLTTPATVDHTGAHSDAATTRVAFAVDVSQTKARVASSSPTFVVNGVVSPTRAGIVVERQRLVDGVWKPRGTTTTAADGRFSFSVRTQKAGIRTLRVVALPGELDAGRSARITLTVS